MSDPLKIRYVEHPYGQPLSIAVEQWQKQFGNRPVLALVASDDEKAVPAIQNLFTGRKIPICGAIFPGLIAGGQITDKGAVLMPLPERTRVFLSEPLSSHGAIHNLVSRIKEQREDDVTLFMIFDALLPDIATRLEQIYSELGIHYAYGGANAGTKTLKSNPCLFDHTSFEKGRVLVLMLPNATEAMVEHGFPDTEDTFMATSSTGNLIRTLDWRPAFSSYRELIGKNYQVEVSKDNFYSYSVHFPFGIVRANGELLIRIPSNFNEKGEIFCIGEIPPNALLKVLNGPPDDLIRGVERLVSRVKESPGDESLLFYCRGRYMHLGAKGCQRELDILSSAIGPCFGAMSLGEIGTTMRDQYPLFHNAVIEIVRYSL